MSQDTKFAKLGVISLGLALGTTAAIFIFLLGLAAAFFGWGIVAAAALSSIFIGYGPTLVGSLAGAVWAFFDGFIAGALIAWLYNRFLAVRRSNEK